MVKFVTDFLKMENPKFQIEYLFSALEIINNNVKSGIIFIDQDMKIINTNVVFDTIFNIEKVDVIGKKVDDICSFSSKTDERIDLKKRIGKSEKDYYENDINMSIFLKSQHVDLKAFPLQIGEKFEGYIIIVDDTTERRELQNQLLKYSDVDSLTGIYSRNMGLRFLENEIKFIESSDKKLSICYIDLDGLKQINSSYGLNEGDEYIKISVNIFKDSIRENDVICRLGSSEFLLILNDCTKFQGEEIWKRVNEKMNRFNRGKIKKYNISGFHGIVEYDNMVYSKIDEFLNAADSNLQIEKIIGKSKKEYEK